MVNPGFDRAKRREFLERLVREHPTSGEAWLEYAWLLDHECHNPRSASRAYEEAQRLLPDRGDIGLLRGSALVEAGEIKQGLTLIIERLKISPSSHAYCILAKVMLDRGKALTATRLLQKAILLDPDFEESYYLMGRALCDASKRREAIDYFREAVKRDESYQIAWQQLGVSLIREEKSRGEGIKALHRAVALDPEDPWSLLYLGIALWQEGRIREAVPFYRRAHELCPADPDFRRWYDEILAAVREKGT